MAMGLVVGVILGGLMPKWLADRLFGAKPA